MNKKITIFGLFAAATVFFCYRFKNKEVAKLSGREQSSPGVPDSGINLTGNLHTRGQRNNNPFNIRYSAANNWRGQTGNDGAFCVFSDLKYGIRAGGVLLRNYLKAGNNTIKKIITKFAPAADGNNTSKYIADVAAASGIGAETVLKDTDLWRIARPMMAIESRYIAKEEDEQYFNNKNV